MKIASGTNLPKMGVKQVAMDDQALTAILANKVMGWKVTADRFIKPGRSWVPRWRFAPLQRLEDAFELLNRAKGDYKLMVIDGGTFTAEVRVDGRTGRAAGEPKARTITMALVQALGLERPMSDPVSIPSDGIGSRSWSKTDGI